MSVGCSATVVIRCVSDSWSLAVQAGCTHWPVVRIGLSCLGVRLRVRVLVPGRRLSGGGFVRWQM